MSSVGPAYRSHLPIDHGDLLRLRDIARRDQETFFAKHPHWADLYADRLLCVALCQGAALHHVHGAKGINDFDLFTFYRAHPARRWPARRRAVYDFGDPKFGQSKNKPQFVGRRVDCMGRSIDVQPDEEPVAALQRYLREGRTETARRLAEQAVVLLEPDCGKVEWVGEVGFG